MEVAERCQDTQIKDKSKVFNTARIEALELDNLIEVAKATMFPPRPARSRVAPTCATMRSIRREPGRSRRQANWLKHTLWYREGNRLDYKPVNLKPMTVDTIALKKRAY
jgi:succinate dehydrogenase / fumarate reductase flavoprotein subunit